MLPGEVGAGGPAVQLKPDPSAKGGQKRDPSVDALKDENAGLRERVDVLEGAVSTQGKELEVTRSSYVISTLLDAPILPHQQVEVRGPKNERTVSRSTWETERGRENTLHIVTDDPYLHMPYGR